MPHLLRHLTKPATGKMLLSMWFQKRTAAQLQQTGRLSSSATKSTIDNLLADQLITASTDTETTQYTISRALRDKIASNMARLIVTGLLAVATILLRVSDRSYDRRQQQRLQERIQERYFY